MSIIHKLKFWKHEEELPPLPEIPSIGEKKIPEPGHFAGLGIEPLHDESPSFAQPSSPLSFTPTFSAPQPQQPSFAGDKDFQLLNAKLDTIRAQLENISQRLERIERIANEAQQQEKEVVRWR